MFSLKETLYYYYKWKLISFAIESNIKKIKIGMCV